LGEIFDKNRVIVGMMLGDDIMMFQSCVFVHRLPFNHYGKFIDCKHV